MLEHNGRGKLDAQAAGAERGGGGVWKGKWKDNLGIMDDQFQAAAFWLRLGWSG